MEMSGCYVYFAPAKSTFTQRLNSIVHWLWLRNLDDLSAGPLTGTPTPKLTSKGYLMSIGCKNAHAGENLELNLSGVSEL